MSFSVSAVAILRWERRTTTASGQISHFGLEAFPLDCWSLIAVRAQEPNSNSDTYVYILLFSVTRNASNGEHAPRAAFF